MNLPEPSATDLLRSDALLADICTEIEKNNGAISFARYMDRALYTPSLGYYNAQHTVFGTDGDFITAPTLSPLFARCLAQNCATVLNVMPHGCLAEIGAGNGMLARDLLLALQDAETLPRAYYIIEISQPLRQQQHALLQRDCPALLERIHWLDQLPDAFSGIVIANEVLDALPVHCFTIHPQTILERAVGIQDHQLQWLEKPASRLLVNSIEKIREKYELPTGYQSEIRLALTPWIQAIANKLQHGCVLLFDYGYGRREYYHPARQQGTLTCFYRHYRHNNPFCWPGLQDITAHVDFTAVAEAGTDAGLHLTGFTTQAHFLLDSGLLTTSPTQLSPKELFAQAQIIKTLTLPSEMGEVIKVMGFHTDSARAIALPGFSGLQRGDRRHELQV